MSGTFMDGGGNDHGGHAVHSGGGETFHDGGGHDHHGHDHGNLGNGLDCVTDGANHNFMHHAHEGGGFLSNLFGLNQQHQHSFLAHLLGLDHDAHVAHGAGNNIGTGAGHAPIAQIPFWSVALQGITVSSLFQGMRLTPAGWMLILFLSYVSWLCVVYWIRRHEPIANAVIGTNQAQRVDHRMLAGTHNLVPISSQSVLPVPPQFGHSNPVAPGSADAAALTGRSIPVHLGPPVTPISPTPEVPVLMPTAIGVPSNQPSAMNIPVREPTGTRVKTIVNR